MTTNSAGGDDTARPTGPTHVLLLRGINVGQHHAVPMAELRELLEGLGHHAVSTYLRSGNVLLRPQQTDAAASPDTLAATTTAAISDRFGFDVPVVVRDRAALVAVVESTVFPDADPARLHVGFVADDGGDGVPADLADALGLGSPSDYAPDDYRVRGTHVLLHTPDGLARSRLADRLARPPKDAPVVTVRTWRTVTTLVNRLPAPG